ncbi:ankyrin repeat domain-containing protein SOWAHC-like [Trichomycterus rosablanca]|uniref:ankyrin repeat domain-containing protein SOWAHC-like n=1 Tax=Trichomycterus rosablanca TaxID=2290929 RepID=UPI002F351BBD
MAIECTQDAVLRFLTERGGRVRNTDLIEHFKAVMPTDPVRKSAAREAFKSYVDSVAVVKVENGEKYVCLRKRCRGSPAQPGEQGATKHHVVPVKLCDHVDNKVPTGRCGNKDAKQEIPPASGCDTDVCQIASQTVVDGSTTSIGYKYKGCRNEDAKEKIPTSSGSRLHPTSSRITLDESPLSKSKLCENKYAKQEIPPASDDNINCVKGVQILVTNSETTLDGLNQILPSFGSDSGLDGKEMGNQHTRRKSKPSLGSDDTLQISNPLGIPEMTLTEASPIPATARTAFDLSCLPTNIQALSEGVPDQTCSRLGKLQGESNLKSHEEETKSGKGSPRLRDEERPDTASNSPKGSRKNFLEHMMSSSPQVRRSMVLKHSVRIRESTVKTDGVSDSVNSSNVEDESAPVTLDPVEHEWMMCACDGEWDSLHRLLESEPSLVTKKDFVTGFTCLHWAAKLGKHELLALLVNFARQRGILLNVNARSSAGYTPLHLAAMHNNIEVIKMLVGACDADVEVRDYNGKKAGQYLRSDVAQDVLDIAGAEASGSTENSEPVLEDDTSRWKLPRVLQANLKLLNRSASEDDAHDGLGFLREKPLRRKSSLNKLKPRLSKRGVGPPIVHSTSLFERLEGATSQAHGSFKTRPKSNLFG